jgi:hypothetical protein
MSRHQFSDDCPGCRPALIDFKTGQVIPEDDPVMQSVLAIWAKTTRKEREVFHCVTCLNSRVPSDLRIFKTVTDRIQGAFDRD